MKIIFASNITDYKTTGKVGGISCHTMLHKDNKHTAVKGDIFVDTTRNVIYQIVEVYDEKSIRIAPWEADMPINIEAGREYPINGKRIA